MSCSPTSARWPDRGRPTRSCSTTAADAGRTIRFEATVGAGLPVIDTHKKLAETGDRVLRIDGCVSGTLMFVLSEVSRGRPFSAAVLDAVHARLRRARSARRPVGTGRRPQGRHPGAAARLSRRRADARGPGACGAEAAAGHGVHAPPAVARRRVAAARGPRGRARPGPALRRERDPDARLGAAGGGAGHQPDGLGRRRPQPHHLHLGALSRRAAGGERSRAPVRR